MNEQQVRAFVGGNGAGPIHYIEGPSKVGSLVCWQVWTKQSGEFHTRYVVESQSAPASYFDAFPPFAMHVDGVLHAVILQSDSARLDRLTRETDLKLRKFSYYVASFAFVAAVLAVIYLMVFQSDTRTLVVTTFLGLVSSGGALFFGRWLLPKGES